MIKHQGSAQRTLSSLPNRRDLMQVGFSTALGMGLSGLVTARAASDDRSKRSQGRAKSLILVYQTGGASQIDTLDPKPNAPDGVRGEFKPIATRATGIQVCEHLPKFASQADRWAIV